MKTFFEKIASLPDRLLQELKGIKDEIAAAHDTYKSATNERQTKPSVHILSRSQAEIDEDERRRKEQQGYQNRNLLINTLSTAVTAVIAVATIVSAIGAARSVTISKKSTEATLRQSQLEQRAWIAIAAAVVPFKRVPISPANPLASLTQTPFSIRVMFKNTGRTPAMNMQSIVLDASISTQSSELPQPNFAAAQKLGYMGNLSPDATSFSDHGYTLDQKTLDQILSSRRYVFVFGRVEYDDVYGRHHWANYCMYLSAGGEFAQCPFHNEVDVDALQR